MFLNAQMRALGMPPQHPQTLAVQDRGDFHCAEMFHSQENSHISNSSGGKEGALPNSARVT